MTIHREQYDIAILGSGFGGSLLASILCQQGFKVCLIDKSVHPRFAIGESSTPAADMILYSLAVNYGLDELIPLCRFGTWQESYPDIHCGCKRGFSYFWHGGDSGFQSTPNHEHELLVAASESRDVADTQWYRADVDHLFCNVAVKRGAVLYENTYVEGIHHTGLNHWKIRLQNDESNEIHSSFIVDATGGSSVLLKSLHVPKLTHQLQTNSSAVYSHFNSVPNVDQWLIGHGIQQDDYPYPVDDSAIHHVFDDGWLWQLRFENGPTSMGFVYNNETHHFEFQPHEEWETLLNSHPALKRVCADFKLSQHPGKVFRVNRLQRLFSLNAGDDWAALPFTAGFIDPLHSTGIAHTLIGVQRLAEILIDCGVGNSSERLREYSDKILNEFFHIDRLVAGCYRHMNNFERFKSWTMVYFAAATTFEQRYHSGSEDFLCAADGEFHGIVAQLFDELCSLNQSECTTEQFVDHIRREIEPFNTVGLFEPEVNNMYRYTAAEK